MAISLINSITINPEVAHGKPTICNKRYTVEGLLEYLAGGDSIEELFLSLPFSENIFSFYAIENDCRLPNLRWQVNQ